MATAALAAGTGHAQTGAFPSGPLRIVVPYAGGLADEDPRFFAQLITKMTNNNMVVESRPGGSGVIAANAVKSAPADGHTLLYGAISLMAVNPVVVKDLQYDPFKDFRPVHGLVQSPGALIVKADSPHKTLKDVVNTANRESRPIPIGNYSNMFQLLAAWLATEAKVPVTHIRYKGAAPMITDVIGGQLEVGFVDFSSAAQLVQSGKARILAITAEKRHPGLPNVPTLAESGYPVVNVGWAGVFVRAQTPDAIVQKLSDMFSAAMQTPEANARYASRPGVEPFMLNAQQLGDFYRKDYEKFKRIADIAKIIPE